LIVSLPSFPPIPIQQGTLREFCEKAALLGGGADTVVCKVTSMPGDVKVQGIVPAMRFGAGIELRRVLTQVEGSITVKISHSPGDITMNPEEADKIRVEWREGAFKAGE